MSDNGMRERLFSHESWNMVVEGESCPGFDIETVLAFAASERALERSELLKLASEGQGIGVDAGIKMLGRLNREAEDDGIANSALAVLGELERRAIIKSADRDERAKGSE